MLFFNFFNFFAIFFLEFSILGRVGIDWNENFFSPFLGLSLPVLASFEAIMMFLNFFAIFFGILYSELGRDRSERDFFFSRSLLVPTRFVLKRSRIDVF